MSQANTVVDPERIRSSGEERGGRPTRVKWTAGKARPDILERDPRDRSRRLQPDALYRFGDAEELGVLARAALPGRRGPKLAIR